MYLQEMGLAIRMLIKHIKRFETARHEQTQQSTQHDP
jgi:hypothetical protein